MIAQEVFPGIYLLPGGHGTFNTYAYILGGDHPLLVDTIVRDKVEPVILPALAELKLTPTQIVITHAHADHFGGLGAIHAAYPDATVWAHPDDTGWISSVDRYLEEMYREYGREAGFAFDEERLNWVRSLISGPLLVRHRLHSGQILSTGRFELEVFHVPGHSPGHIALVDRARRFALVADAVLGDGIVDRNGVRPFAPIYTDPIQYRRSLQAIRNWNVEWLVVGHGPLLDEQAATQFLEKSERFVDRCDDVIQTALLAVSDGLDFASLAQRVDASLGPYPLGLVGFPCILAHLRHLESKGLVLETRDTDRPKWASTS